MSGGNKVVGLWRDAEQGGPRAIDFGDALVDMSPAPQFEAVDFDPPPAQDTRARIGTGIALLAAVGWTAAVGWEWASRLAGAMPSLTDITSIIATLSAPLALIAIIWMLFQRSGRAEQRRFAATADMIDVEARRLQAVFDLIGARIGENKAALAEQADTLMGLGDDAAARLNAITRAMDVEIETVNRHTQQLTGSAAAARGDLAVLLSSLPKANVQTRQMIASLQEAGLAAHEHAGALDAQLTLLTVRGREANDIAGNAAQKLAAHLARMESVSEVAGDRLEAAAQQMTEAVDEALERAGHALDAARQGMEAQGAAMMAMVGQNQAAMARAGDEAAESLQSRISVIGERIDAVASSFSQQDQRAEALIARLREDLDMIEARFATFDAAGIERVDRLSMAIKALRDHSDDMTQALGGSADNANVLAERVQSLMTALDATQREVDETLPTAFAKLETRAANAMSIVETAGPAIRDISDIANASLDRLQSLSTLIAEQRADVEALSRRGVESVGELSAVSDTIAARITEAQNEAARLSDGTVPQLHQALKAVEERAVQTGLATRSALDDAVQHAARNLGERTSETLAAALTAQVESQLGAVATTTEQAIAAAQKATDRLMRQMLTISDTTAALEARIAEAKDGIERSDQANFARRVALLIESLNSTAIDVTKLLSNEVTDTAWAAYLRGDRGVFSRRAVKLLDASQVREIAQHYESDAEFREQVNRYIHDFESMLRNVLATRDGSLLGVTLLSSDNGKLYVALAQAIERLRT